MALSGRDPRVWVQTLGGLGVGSRYAEGGEISCRLSDVVVLSVLFVEWAFVRCVVCGCFVEACAPGTFGGIPRFIFVLGSSVLAGAQTTPWVFLAVFGHVVSLFAAPVAYSYLCGEYRSGRGPPDLQCPFEDCRGGDQDCLGFPSCLSNCDVFF